jgi:UDP-N-acetylmuramoylalanine--D-glutamate ligase
MSLFLASYRGPVFAITGTKGKSTVASALHHILLATHPGARLGGNITVSPLSFCAELEGNEPVVLELSSFQLGDLLLTPAGAAATSRFTLSAITNLLPDHQDYYASMSDYAADKALIFAGQSDDAWCLLSDDDEWSRAYRPPHDERVIRVTSSALRSARSRVAGFNNGAGALRLPDVDRAVTLVEPTARSRGAHQRTNLLFAGTAAYLSGVPESVVRKRASSFPGVPHRLELIGVHDGVQFVNDSAATIAEAAVAAVEAFGEPIHLIAGGSDKRVPVDAFACIASRVRSLHLLAGSATERIVGLLDGLRLPYTGPYGSLETAFGAAAAAARAGEVVMLSPGCASFGMFRNEFDRGDQFRRLVEARNAR